MKPLDLNKLFVVALGLTLLANSACLPPSTPAPPTPASVTPPLTASATILWFPPTATHTPQPTTLPSATPATLPGLGAQLFSEDFSSPADWTNASAASQGANNILVSANRLTLAANQSPVTLSSLRGGLILTDFFAETTLDIHRCGAKDSFGLLYHAGSEAYAYRYVLTCDGQQRVDRLRSGEVYPLSDFEPSGDLPSGAPGQVRLGLWVAGVEMRFFLNGHFQFALLDPMFRSGGLGVFANVLSPEGLNISFSDLRVHAVSYLSPTPTATASRTPLPSRTPRPTP